MQIHADDPKLTSQRWATWKEGQRCLRKAACNSRTLGEHLGNPSNVRESIQGVFIGIGLELDDL